MPPQPPQMFYSQGFWVFSFPCWNPGFHGPSRSPSFPLAYLCANVGSSMWSTALPYQASSSPGLCISAPPTSLDECFFNSSVVGLPCKWFSGSSGCSLFLNWLLSFFWLCKEAKRFCLCFHLIVYCFQLTFEFLELRDPALYFLVGCPLSSAQFWAHKCFMDEWMFEQMNE